MIVIVNYGMGNLRSIQNGFTRLGIKCIISSRIDDIEKADKLVLPGVGHFRTAMENLQNIDLIELLNFKVLDKNTSILGICLGAQLFAKFSQEGNSEGLGWLNAEVVKFNVSDELKYKIPHIGWNNIKIINRNGLEKNINKDEEFYFVHRYHLVCNDPSDIWMTSEYDYEFVSAIQHGNIYGTQFHPEKSHDAGNNLLKQFAEI